MRLRRAKNILAYWRGDHLVLENYQTGVAITADPLTLCVLDFFRTWRSATAFCRHMPQYTRHSVLRALKHLTRRTFLLREGSLQARQDAQFEREWSPWLPEAGFFHFRTKDSPVEVRERGIERILRGYLAASPQPAFFKKYRNASSFRLPPIKSRPTEFAEVALRRRTYREFSPQSMPLEALSELLFYTWGVTGHVEAPLLGRLPLKTSPSAGARHPGEAYVLALRVQGLRPGLYHYAPERHVLQLLGSTTLSLARLEKKAVAYCAGQAWVRKAAALFVMTAVFRRTMWKYRTPRAYRTVLLDAGHLCQTFLLVATGLRLAPFCTMALKDSLIERDLGLDGISESVLYIAGAGLPRPARSSAPAMDSRFLASL